MSSPSEYLHNIIINNFRNITQLNMVFDEFYNIFIGPNGQGKTNCLEAVALAVSLRSLQGLKNKDLIKHDCPSAQINAQFNGHYPMNLSIEIHQQGKRVKLNHRQLKKRCE